MSAGFVRRMTAQFTTAITTHTARNAHARSHLRLPADTKRSAPYMPIPKSILSASLNSTLRAFGSCDCAVQSSLMADTAAHRLYRTEAARYHT